MFADFANFVDHEARIATNPVFGRILSLEDARPKLDRRDARLQKRSVSKRPGELSFAAQVDSSQNSPACVATPRGSANSVGEMSCLYCNAGHALENCRSLRNRSDSERIGRVPKVERPLSLVVCLMVTGQEIALRGKRVRFQTAPGSTLPFYARTLRHETRKLSTHPPVYRYVRESRAFTMLW